MKNRAIISISDYDKNNCLFTFMPREGGEPAQGKLSKRDLLNLKKALESRIARMNAK